MGRPGAILRGKGWKVRKILLSGPEKWANKDWLKFPSMGRAISCLFKYCPQDGENWLSVTAYVGSCKGETRSLGGWLGGVVEGLDLRQLQREK